MYNRNVFEIVVGIIVIICSGLFLIFAYKNEVISIKDDYYVLYASFAKVEGINIGSDVNVSGVSVGKVINKKLDKQNYNAVLTMTIQKDLELPVDTSAEITSSSLLGDKYVLLVPGAETDSLRDGDTIEFTQSSINLENLISKFAFGIENNKQKE